LLEKKDFVGVKRLKVGTTLVNSPRIYQETPAKKKEGITNRKLSKGECLTRQVRAYKLGKLVFIKRSYTAGGGDERKGGWYKNL